MNKVDAAPASTLDARLINGEDRRDQWLATAPYELRRMKPDRRVDTWPDDLWEMGVEVWSCSSVLEFRTVDGTQILASR